MKSILFYLIIIVLFSLYFFSCSDLEENITPPQNTVGVHPAKFADPASSTFHGNLIKQNNWDLTECKTCHASNYEGGLTGQSCFECHTSKEGPEACNTCHGNFDNGTFTDSTRIAPPRAVFSENNAGAHVSHLYENDLTANVNCEQCHIVPGNVNDPGHIVPGATHATLAFGNLAKNQGANPNYDFNTKKCSNVYCHGNFSFLKDSSANSYIYVDSVIVGNNFEPQWNKLDDTQGECGTCHALPPTGHLNAGNDPDAASCATCHSSVVGSDGTIIDSTKHINGKINVFGKEF